MPTEENQKSSLDSLAAGFKGLGYALVRALVVELGINVQLRPIRF